MALILKALEGDEPLYPVARTTAPQNMPARPIADPANPVVIFQNMQAMQADLLQENRTLHAEVKELQGLVAQCHDHLITKSLQNLFRIVDTDPGLKIRVDSRVKAHENEALKPYLMIKAIEEILVEDAAPVTSDSEFEDCTFIKTEANRYKDLRAAFTTYRKTLAQLGETITPQLKPEQLETLMSDFTASLKKPERQCQCNHKCDHSSGMVLPIIAGTAAGTVSALTILYMAYQASLKTVDTACNIVKTVAVVLIAVSTFIGTVTIAGYKLLAPKKNDAKAN